jgi:hypothetical protein
LGKESTRKEEKGLGLRNHMGHHFLAGTEWPLQVESMVEMEYPLKWKRTGPGGSRLWSGALAPETFP